MSLNPLWFVIILSALAMWGVALMLVLDAMHV
jgi:hypothetical protein